MEHAPSAVEGDHNPYQILTIPGLLLEFFLFQNEFVGLFCTYRCLVFSHCSLHTWHLLVRPPNDLFICLESKAPYPNIPGFHNLTSACLCTSSLAILSHMTLCSSLAKLLTVPENVRVPFFVFVLVFAFVWNIFLPFYLANSYFSFKCWLSVYPLQEDFCFHLTSPLE